MGYTLDTKDFNALLLKLGDEYDIYAPKRFKDKGRFSDQDMIRYDKVSTVEEIVWKEKSNFSPKDVVIPPTQTLFYFTEDEYREPAIDDRKILVFLRACDINAMRRCDTIYLKNGKEKDYYYKRLREKVVFVLMECNESFENCFCVSMKSNETDDFSMAVKFSDNGYLVSLKDELFTSNFNNCKEADYTPTFIAENKQKVIVPDVKEMPSEIYNHEMWREYDSRCIACGRCTTTCPTCTCHTTTDIYYDDNPKVGERRRTWSSCHINGFAKMAGGHDFRTRNGDRMRFKTLHKVYDYNKRFGEHMCVGCGRCDDNCPEYISFANTINKLTETLRRGE